MLKRALRGEPLDDDWTPDLNIGLTGMIPEAYVNEPEMRINLYARLARLDPSENTDDLEAEIEDRFGPMPEPVRHLLGLTELKQACRRAGVARIDAGPQAIALTFRPGAAERLPVQQMIETSGGALRWSGERLILAVSEEDGERRQTRIAELLDRLQP
jgi:transcription-repair coupling factor (superfamily II helicase)